MQDIFILPDTSSATPVSSDSVTAQAGVLSWSPPPERQWNLSGIAILPYFQFDSDAKSQLGETSGRLADVVSGFESYHLQSNRYEETLDQYDDLDDFIKTRKDDIDRLFSQMEEKKLAIDDIVANELEISTEVLDRIEREAELRYGEYEPIPYGPEKIATTYI